MFPPAAVHDSAWLAPPISTKVEVNGLLEAKSSESTVMGIHVAEPVVGPVKIATPALLDPLSPALMTVFPWPTAVTAAVRRTRRAYRCYGTIRA